MEKRTKLRRSSPTKDRPRLADLPDLPTVEETAAWFGCSPGTVRRMLRDGRLPRVKVGRLDRTSKVALEKLRDGK